MPRRPSIEIELRGQAVTFEYTPTDYDPSVGMMGEGFEDPVIIDAFGNTLDWELTDEEKDEVLDAIQEAYGGEDDGDFDEDYDDRGYN